MTELQFLLHLYMEHKLPKATKELIKERIGTVENNIAVAAPVPKPQPSAPITPLGIAAPAPGPPPRPGTQALTGEVPHRDGHSVGPRKW